MFESTGGIHAAGLFTADGEPVCVREDVGRHNAMDKLVGERLLAGATPLHGHIALVSGRASFELVQKAAVAGVPIVCAVSAPSSLAVETARAARRHAGRLPARRALQRVHASSPDRAALVGATPESADADPERANFPEGVSCAAAGSDPSSV